MALIVGALALFFYAGQIFYSAGMPMAAANSIGKILSSQLII